jgi:23S rRNA pseudouridine1911/1915/1917 synthase
MVSSELRLEVGPDDVGRRLDQFLAEPLGSRAQAARLISEGAVTVDGRAVQKRHLVSPGEEIIVERGDVSGSGLAGPDPADGRSTAPFTVPYEDEHLLIVDKPAGVIVHPGRGHPDGTLAQALAGRAVGGEDPYRAGIVHRLDRDTSGLLVVAKTDEAHRRLKALLASRQLRREYLALVDGVPSARTGTIDAPIGRDRGDRLRVSLDSDHVREARTHFEIEELLPGGLTLLRVSLETGRTHQIRVHMQAIGHPVVGDPIYGGIATGARLGLSRQFLHAARLAFPHPLTGVAVDVSSPLPDDLVAALGVSAGRGGYTSKTS